MQDGQFARLRTSKGQIGLGRLTLRLETLRQGSWMLAATLIAGGLNYLANAAVGRLLGPADYSIYASMLSLTLVLGAVTAIIQTVTTNYVAQLRATGRMEDVGALLSYLLRRLLPWGVFGVALVWLLGHPLADLLHLPSPAPVWVMGTVMLPIVALPVLQGGVRGLERYGAFGSTLIGMALLRLGIGVGLILIGWGAVGAVASLPLSNLGACALGLVWLVDVFRSRNREFKPDRSNILSYAMYVAIGLAAYTVLTNIDVVIVKGNFMPEEAGLYSAVATTGKIALYLPAAVATLLLPKVAIRNANGERTALLLYKSLAVVGGLCSAVALVFFLFASPVVQLLFGARYLSQARLLGPYGLAMTLYALCNIWLAYYLALQERRYSYLLLGVVIVQAALLSSSSGLPEVVAVLVGGGVVLNLLGGWLLLQSKCSRRNG